MARACAYIIWSWNERLLSIDQAKPKTIWWFQFSSFLNQSKLNHGHHHSAPAIVLHSFVLFFPYTFTHLYTHAHTDTQTHTCAHLACARGNRTKSSVIIWDHSRNRIIFTFFSFYGCIRLSYEILMNRRLFCRFFASLLFSHCCCWCCCCCCEYNLNRRSHQIQKQKQQQKLCSSANYPGHAVMFSSCSIVRTRTKRRKNNFRPNKQLTTGNRQQPPLQLHTNHSKQSNAPNNETMICMLHRESIIYAYVDALTQQMHDVVLHLNKHTFVYRFAMLFASDFVAASTCCIIVIIIVSIHFCIDMHVYAVHMSDVITFFGHIFGFLCRFFLSFVLSWLLFSFLLSLRLRVSVTLFSHNYHFYHTSLSEQLELKPFIVLTLLLLLALPFLMNTDDALQ